MKKLSYYIFIVFLIFFNSCATVATKYDLYYSVMDTDDINMKKETGFTFKITPPKDSTIQDDVSFSFRINNEFYITVYVDSKTPINIDNELSWININGIPSRLFDKKVKSPVQLSKGFKEIANIRASVNSHDLIYDTYKNEGFLIKEKDTEISVIEFSKESSPYRITGEIVYYTEQENKEMKKCKINIFQSVLYTVKGVSAENYNDWWNYRKNEIAFDKKEVIGSKTSISGNNTGQGVLSVVQLIFYPFYLLFGKI